MGKNKGKQLDLSKRKVIAKALEDDKTATEIASSFTACYNKSFQYYFSTLSE